MKIQKFGKIIFVIIDIHAYIDRYDDHILYIIPKNGIPVLQEHFPWAEVLGIEIFYLVFSVVFFSLFDAVAAYALRVVAAHHKNLFYISLLE